MVRFRRSCVRCGLRGILLVGAAACLGILSTSASAGSRAFNPSSQSAHDSPSAESIVRFVPGTSAADMTKIATDAGGDVATVMPEISAVAVRSDSASFDSTVEANPKVDSVFVDRYISWGPSDERAPAAGSAPSPARFETRPCRRSPGTGRSADSAAPGCTPAPGLRRLSCSKVFRRTNAE